MTAEQEVKKKYPKAFLFKHTLWTTSYRIFKSRRSEVDLSDWKPRAISAWADALRRIKEAKSDPLQ